MKARIKRYGMYTVTSFGREAIVDIHCFPQQEWVVKINDEKVTLSRLNIDFTIPLKDFEDHWLIIKGKEGKENECSKDE